MANFLKSVAEIPSNQGYHDLSMMCLFIMRSHVLYANARLARVLKAL